jgi:6-pyruvoyltetrahydropterin/6-carboxytetrahydropterin synthase
LYSILVKDKFSSAHKLRNYNGKCENMHGHTFEVELYLELESLNEIGISIDFKDCKIVLKEELNLLDHTCINDIEPFDKINPSAENIAAYLYKKIKTKLPFLKEVFVWESENARASYKE